MARTADAAGWKTHEDEILYSIITNALALNMPATECYKKASEVFHQLDHCTNREWNACRQRWSKIKNDTKLEKELDFNPLEYMPPTTGIQEELDFNEEEEKVVSSDNKSVQEELEQKAPNPEEADTPNEEEAEGVDPSSDGKEVPIELMTIPESTGEHAQLILTSLLAIQLKQKKTEDENAELKRQLAERDAEIERLTKDLRKFQQIKNLMSGQ